MLAPQYARNAPRSSFRWQPGFYQLTIKGSLILHHVSPGLGLDGRWTNDTLTFQYNQAGLGTGLLIQGGRSVWTRYDSLNRLDRVQAGSLTFLHGYSGASPLV